MGVNKLIQNGSFAVLFLVLNIWNDHKMIACMYTINLGEKLASLPKALVTVFAIKFFPGFPCFKYMYVVPALLR